MSRESEKHGDRWCEEGEGRILFFALGGVWKVAVASDKALLSGHKLLLSYWQAGRLEMID